MKMPTFESSRAPFEVCCPRCEVTFPIGTKRCIHCGGRTVPSSRPGESGQIETLRRSEGGEASDPFDWDSESGFDPAEYDGTERELEMDDESPPVGRTLARSLGGLVWVIALIVFSIARNCGDK